MPSLYTHCSQFLSAIASVDLEIRPNPNPFLKELSEIKDFEERVEFAKDELGKPLGEGSARTVFQFNDKLVLKIAHNDKGIEQNLVEADPSKQRPITNRVFAADPKGKWILVLDNESITEKEFKELTGMGFKAFCNALHYAFNAEDEEIPPREFDEIKHNPFYKEVALLILDNSMLVGDLEKISSYGKLNGKVVIRDYGIDRPTWKKFYDDSSSSS